MIAKLLGLVDLLAVVCLFIGRFLPSDFVMTISMLLSIKGILFASMMNIISVLDAIAGVYIGLAIVYGIGNSAITTFFIIYLLQKGLLSLLAR